MISRNNLKSLDKIFVERVKADELGLLGKVDDNSLKKNCISFL